uniref:Uncharacterized protein n=1 Tax=Rhizophora mucronata TaxID=61149 RepID=A0A2P2PU98_RHIMU
MLTAEGGKCDSLPSALVFKQFVNLLICQRYLGTAHDCGFHHVSDVLFHFFNFYRVFAFNS